MQLPNTHRIRSPAPTFSILGRIGGDATVGPPIRGGGARHFQYPRSDRRRCNASLYHTITHTIVSFSILGRIGGDATVAGYLAEKLSEIAFSILGRIGGDATGV